MIRNISVILCLLPMFLSCVTQESVSHKEYIAHAGGGIDGYIYTNSLEAMLQAAENGYRYIELDLLLASDSVLVAAHSWEEFNEMTGNAQWGDSVLSSADFARQRIHGLYTPLTAPVIERFFLDNDSLYLVTDKVSNPALLAKAFPSLKERMVVEAFSYDDYRQLCAEGYYRVLYSCMANDLSSALMKHLLFSNFFPGERIGWITLHTSGLSHRMYRFLNKVRRFNVALFTVDSQNDVEPEHLERAGMVYTNTILPE